jgi:hypothetical protein
MPQPGPLPSRSSRSEGGIASSFLRRRVLVVAVVAGALLGVIGIVSAQEAGQPPPGQGDATTTTVGQLDPNDPSQTGKQSCDESNLEKHDGFQNAPRCVAIDQGEVSAHAPAALITSALDNLQAGQAFQITANFRNVVRDRFAAAANGGYYHFMSELDGNGITHGHAHFYVQNIGDGAEAPDGDAGPLDFFKAVEDGGGGAAPSSVTVDVPGLNAGSYRACVTLGDSSHRPPMMSAAKIAVGIDCTRFTVGGGGNGGGGGGGGNDGATTTTAAQETTTTEAKQTTTTEAQATTTAPPDTTQAPPDTTQAPPDTTAQQGGQAPPVTEAPPPPPPAQQAPAQQGNQAAPVATNAAAQGVVDEGSGTDQIVTAPGVQGPLPFTGAPSGLLLAVGVMLVVGGCAFLLFTDGRRRPSHVAR